MKTYELKMTVKAEKTTRQEYNDYRGWELPSDEDGSDEGYLILKTCGNESWQPKELFERDATIVEK